MIEKKVGFQMINSMKQQLLTKKPGSKRRSSIAAKKKRMQGYYLWKIPVSVKQEVDCLSEERHMEPLKFLQEVLDQVIEKERPSLYDLSKHILEKGKFRGPGTLSSDKKHLEGFGRKRAKKV